MSTTDIERTLVAWFDEVEPRATPPAVLDRSLAVTRLTAQRRPLLARINAAVADARVLPRIDVSPVIALALIALLVLLLVGALVAGSVLPRRTGWRTLGETGVEGSYTWVNQVATGGPGLVAVGTTALPVATSCGREIRGRVWASSAGDAWVDRSAATFSDTRMERVVQAGGKMYALGVANAACEESGLPSYATWTSGDAVTWQALADSSALDGSFVNSMIDVGGTPLALGIYQDAAPPDGTGALETRVWAASATGWTLIASVEGVFVTGAAVSAEIVLASVADMEGNSKLLRSDDRGKTWSDAAVALHEIVALAALQGRFVIAGSRLSNEQPEPLTLASTDGRSWTAGEPLQDPFVDMWSLGNRFIAAAVSGSGAPVECAEWASTPPAPAYRSLEPGETPSSETALPQSTESFCVRYRQPALGAWVSGDGLTWTASSRLPDRGDEPPLITVPIPDTSYSVAAAGDAVVITNPTFGERLWFLDPGSNDIAAGEE